MIKVDLILSRDILEQVAENMVCFGDDLYLDEVNYLILRLDILIGLI
jgi:hypothetical protein